MKFGKLALAIYLGTGIIATWGFAALSIGKALLRVS